MAISTLFTQLKRPIQTNKRLFGMVSLAILFIGALGISYYLYIQTKQQEVKEYKLRMLDTYYEKMARQLDNDVLKIRAQEKAGQQLEDVVKSLEQDTISSSYQDKNEYVIDYINQLAHDGGKNCNLIVSDNADCLMQLANRLSFDEEFDEYILHVFGESNENSNLQQSSIDGLNQFNEELIFDNDTLHTGVVKGISINERDYLLISKKYEYTSEIDYRVKRKITLIGLISQNRYNQLTRQLNPWIIALLSALLLLALIGLPFFKMIFIAEDERLFSRDVILSGISVIIGAPVLLIVFLSLISYGNNYFVDIPEKLEFMADSIKHRFESEHQKNMDSLSSFELLAYDYTPRLPEGRNFMSPTLNDRNLKHQFKYLSKLDAQGNVIYHINFIKEPPIGKAPVTLKDRAYYKDIVDKKNLWYYESKEDTFKYVLRPVVSIENSSEEAVYILPKNNGQNYLVASSQLQSVHNPILPFGYKFAIIDEMGEVWFHSKKGKASLENFYSVSDKNNNLRASIFGRIASGGYLTYHGESYLYYSIPIKESNLSIVVLYDLALLRLQVSEVLSISSMAILIAGIMLLFIIIVTVYLRNPKWGLYKYERFAFDFLVPKKELGDQYIYLTCIFAFFLLLLCSIGLAANFLPSTAFMASLLIIIWSYVLVFFTIGKKQEDLNKLSIREFSLAAIVLVLNIIIINLLSGWLPKILLVLAQIACVFFIYASHFKKVKSLLGNVNTNITNLISIPYKYWYAFFLYSWLLVASMLPTYVFYMKSNAFDEVIWIKTNQMHFAESFAEKEHHLKNNILIPSSGEENEFDSVYASHLKNGSYLTSNYLNLKEENRIEKKSDKPTKFRKLLWSTRPIYNEKIRRYQSLIYQHSTDNSWESTEEIDRHIKFRALNNYTNTTDIISDYETKEIASTDVGMKEMILFFSKLIGGLSILLLLYLLILFYVDRFFGFRFMHLKANDLNTTKNGGYIEKFVKMFKDYRANSGLLIVGMPFSGKRNFARRIVEAAGYKTWGGIYFLEPSEEDAKLPIDTLFQKFIRIHNGDAKTDWKNLDVFVLENMEHNLMSFEMSRLKLKIISYLIAERKRIIITSEVYPSQVLAFYQDQKDSEGKISPELASDYNAWRNILSAFPQIMIGIIDKRSELLESLQSDGNFAEVPTGILEEVCEEMGYSQFLPSLAPISLERNIFKVKEFGQDEYYLDDQRMIMHVMNFSHGYYTDIWNSLPRRERYLLYDLAKDGFMNIKNGNSLFSLMKKGLIVWKDRPAIFNQSFRNFIISSVSKAEALSYEYKNRGEGSWGTIRVVLYLVILTVIIFLLLGKPNLMKDFETFYGALAGIGTIIPILGAVMGKNNK